MFNRNYYIHPFVRIVYLICAVFGTFLTKAIFLVLLFYLLAIIPLFFLNKNINIHLKFLFFGVVPIFLSFILINIIILHGKKGGWDFILERVIRITTYSSAIQIVITIPANDLFYTLKKWGFKGESLITVIGTLAVWGDVTNRADKIVTARLSKGYVKNRNLFTMAMQFKNTLNPLIIGVIRTSVERADSWQSKNIILLIKKYKNSKNDYNKLLNFYIIFIAIVYLLSAIFLLIKNTAS